MKITESGGIAVGAPMSLARLQQELNHFVMPYGTLKSLAKTPEGAALLRKYMAWQGGYPADDIATDKGVRRMLANEGASMEAERMQYVCYGALFALEFAMAGRIPSPAQSEKVKTP